MRKLIIAGVVTVALAIGGAAYLLRQNTLTAYKLCIALTFLIDMSDRGLGAPRSSTYDYFHDHPKALTAAHRENRDFLASLPCPAPPAQSRP